jgi:hypothetical protein
MRTHAVGDGLDERGSAARAGLVHRRLDGRVHGQHIIAVYPQRRHGIRQTLDRQGFGLGLPRDRRGDRPLIVLADEDHGRLVDAREVETRVKVVLAGGAVPEEAKGDIACPADLGRPRDADCVRDLRGHGRRRTDVPHLGRANVAGHLTAASHIVGCPQDLREVLGEGQTAIDGRRALAQALNEIVRFQDGLGARDGAGLLTSGLEVVTDASLALQGHELLVQHA